MGVECYEGALISCRPLKYLGVVSTREAGLRRSNHIMSRVAQERGQLDPQHLIEIKAHNAYAASCAVTSVCRMERLA